MSVFYTTASVPNLIYTVRGKLTSGGVTLAGTEVNALKVRYIT
jgi:hypothetical protein